MGGYSDQFGASRAGKLHSKVDSKVGFYLRKTNIFVILLKIGERDARKHLGEPGKDPSGLSPSKLMSVTKGAQSQIQQNAKKIKSSVIDGPCASMP